MGGSRFGSAGDRHRIRCIPFRNEVGVKLALTRYNAATEHYTKPMRTQSFIPHFEGWLCSAFWLRDSRLAARGSAHHGSRLALPTAPRACAKVLHSLGARIDALLCSRVERVLHEAWRVCLNGQRMSYITRRDEAEATPPLCVPGDALGRRRLRQHPALSDRVTPPCGSGILSGVGSRMQRAHLCSCGRVVARSRSKHDAHPARRYPPRRRARRRRARRRGTDDDDDGGEKRLRRVQRPR